MPTTFAGAAGHSECRAGAPRAGDRAPHLSGLVASCFQLISSQAGVEYLKCVAQEAAPETVEVDVNGTCFKPFHTRYGPLRASYVPPFGTPDLLDEAPSSLSAVWPPKTHSSFRSMLTMAAQAIYARHRVIESRE